jgi:hypothetical protein
MLILTYVDDNFASTVSKLAWSIALRFVSYGSIEGVAEGRQIFVNLKRSIQ